MGPPLIVEVADHRGRVRFRTTLDPVRSETTVGRAPRSEIVLDDPYVDARHLRITPTEEGGWRFADLGSLNGVWIGHSGVRRTEGPVTAGLELRIGHSTLRFVSPDAPVPAALFDPAQRAGIARRLLEPRTIAAILVVAAAFSVTTQYYASTRTVDVVDLATPGLAILVFAALWASGWAFTNRLVAQRFRFLAHFAWAVLITTVGSALALAKEWVGFFTPSLDLGFLELSMWWLGGAVLLVGHFELVAEWSRTRRWTVATSAAGVLVVLAAVLARSEALDDGSMMLDTGALKPVDVRYLPAGSLDDFVRDAGSLKSSLDETGPDADPGVRRTRSDSSTATARRLHTSRRAPE